MSQKKTDVNNFVVELSEMMDDYRLEVMRAVEQAAKEGAEVTQKQLKQTSPRKKKKGGKYARGWRIKKHMLGNVNVTYVVYNGTYPGLTHILENGHVSANQYGGGYGRVRGQKHIAPAADAGIMRFNLGVRARLRKVK